jgi:large subunit ribosomal protein L23
VSSIDRMYRLVARPVVTEKGSNDTADRNAYHFRVPVDANKVEIRQAIERVFEVKVKKVNTNQVRGKERRRGWVRGQKPDWKRARVVLAEGSTIDVL